MGSPPRMRGKDLRSACFAFPKGITPAHAGKRKRSEVTESHDQDHPRACGEKAMWCRCYGLSGGSPPRMRGKVLDFFVELIFKGITPAHAGKSHIVSSIGFSHGDHPRACGEKT